MKNTKNNIVRHKVFFIVLSFVTILFVSKISAQENIYQLKAAIQVSTNISDGQHSLYDISKKTKDQAIIKYDADEFTVAFNTCESREPSRYTVNPLQPSSKPNS